MRKIRYSVAMSLDGYIAGPDGDYDWIISDPEIDFAAMFNQFDIFLIGRKTFETMAREGRTEIPGKKIIVFSNTLEGKNYPGITVVGGNYKPLLTSLREESGKDIWLFGGGSLFASLLEAGFVDSVEVAIAPVLLGAGIPLLPAITKRTKLQLTGHRIYKTGIVTLNYAVA